MQTTVIALVQMIDRVVKNDDIVHAALGKVILNTTIHQHRSGGPERGLRTGERRNGCLFAARQQRLDVMDARCPFEGRKIGAESPTAPYIKNSFRFQRDVSKQHCVEVMPNNSRPMVRYFESTQLLVEVAMHHSSRSRSLVRHEIGESARGLAPCAYGAPEWRTGAEPNVFEARFRHHLFNLASSKALLQFGPEPIKGIGAHRVE